MIYTINPEFATKFSRCEVYRILRYKIESFPSGYGVSDQTGKLKISGDKAVETFLQGRKYIASYQEPIWEPDGGYHTPETTDLKIPTGTLYCYEAIAVDKRN